MAETDLSSLSSQELSAATAAIVAGDLAVDKLARDIGSLVSTVNNASRRAVAQAVDLYANDVMAPEGRARLLAAVPRDLVTATAAQLDQAELNLDVAEGVHLAAILKHDSAENATLIAEVSNYIAGMEPTAATETLLGLASDVRYSTLMSGSFGRSLAARFRLKDASIITKVALEALAVNGNRDQVARSKALAAIPALRRAIGLARGGRDQAIQASQRPPRPEPSAALL